MKYKLGAWTFIIGLIISALVAIFSASVVPTWAIYSIAILGMFVGFMNVTDNEVQLFLVATIAFLISFQALSSVFTVLALGWGAVASFFNLMSVFVAPAAAIVAVKAIYDIAKD